MTEGTSPVYSCPFEEKLSSCDRSEKGLGMTLELTSGYSEFSVANIWEGT